MDSERLHDALTQAGLTGYQADVYLAVLALGSAPVVDVAGEAGVPTSQTYDVVRSLADRGYVETIERDRLHVRAIEPTDVLADLREMGTLLTDAAEAIEQRWERPDPDDHRVSVVSRTETVQRSAVEAIENAGMAIELAATPGQFAALRPALEAAAERGVVVRVGVYGSVDVDPEETAITALRHGALPGPFVAVIDRRESFFAPNVHSDEPYGVLLGDEILSLVLHWYFLTCVWERAEIVTTDAGSPTYVSVEEFVSHVAGLLHDGATVTVGIDGTETTTDDPVAFTGELLDVLVDGGRRVGPAPSYEDLAGRVSLVVGTDEGVKTVGGWGARVEAVEASIIRIEGIELPAGGRERTC